MQARLEAAEMWFLRRMCKIKWMYRVTNEEVLRKTGADRALISTIQERQKGSFGHVMQEDGLERLVNLGKVSRKRGRGRPRRKFMDFMWESLGMSHIEAIHRSQDRHEWIVCRQRPL